MNRPGFFPYIILMISALLLGQSDSFGQYYPPAVMVSGLDSNSLMLNGGGGSYSGGFYGYYTYDYTLDSGYWDYTTYGHYETQDQGYWDNSPGHYEDQGSYDNSTGYYDGDGNWISQPTWNSNYVWVSDAPIWVPNSVSVWVNDPTWVNTGSTTYTGTQSVWMSVSLYIDGYGNTSVYSYNTSTGNTDYWTGSYDFSNGGFSGSLPSTWAINTDSSSWSPPPPPPPNPSFGPPSIWVEGTRYSWDHTDYNDTSRTTGTDYYSDGAGHSVWFQSSNGSNTNTSSTGGQSPSGAWWSGGCTNGIFENTGGVDVRTADSSGNYLQGTAPSSLPPAIRVDGSTSVWCYLGQGEAQYHYAGDQPDQRLTIDPSSWVVSVQGDNAQFFSNNVIWSAAGGRDVRAVSIDGSLWQPETQPSWGPPDVWVSGTVWRYAGTWDGTVSFPVSGSPTYGDHYLGDNGGQLLVVDASGNVTISNQAGNSSGTYAPQSQQEGAPRVFTVSGYDVYPGDAYGVYHKTQPAVGPPAVWVNGVTFAFSSSNEDASQLGTWVDTYVDGNNNYILLTSSQVRAFQADGSSNWTGTFVPAGNNQGEGGIFIVANGGFRFDVRASSGVTILPPQVSPQGGHPNVVKVDGSPWDFAGSASGVDYYFGANAGERLWIDSAGAVSFTSSVNSPNLAGAGNLSGSVFLVSGHDLRACTTDTLPVPTSGSRQWGPAALWVEGVVWNYIGTVSDDSLQVHADFYGGLNVGQVVSVNSQMQVSGAYTGVYDGGVFVISGGADLRALDATGKQISPTGTPTHGYPVTLRIGGLHWSYIGSSGGVDYYASQLGGQRLSIDASGSVIYSDRPHNVSAATGLYADGNFTSTGGGVGFNAGTIGSDLDILGNVLSLGSLANDRNSAGLTVSFRDDLSASPYKTSVQFAASRPNSEWSWSRAQSVDNNLSVLQMKLDGSNRLFLFDPVMGTAPSVVIDPSGLTQFQGPVSAAPAGGISMGSFTNRPH